MERKRELFARAEAFLFPITWPEPFGLVMIEAMACGTPVVATPCGSVPEIVEHGVNGWIAAGEEEAARALAGLGRFDRAACRRRFDERFTAERMARDYLGLYRQVARGGTGGVAFRPAA